MENNLNSVIEIHLRIKPIFPKIQQSNITMAERHPSDTAAVRKPIEERGVNSLVTESYKTCPLSRIVMRRGENMPSVCS